MNDKTPALTHDQVEHVLKNTVPFVGDMTIKCDDLKHGSNRLRLTAHANWMRPGGKGGDMFSGPAIMTVADFGVYIGVMSIIGFEPMTVTTNLNVNFLSAAKGGDIGGDLIADSRIIKCGHKIAYGEVLFSMEKQPERTVAHVTATYAIPQKLQT